MRQRARLQENRASCERKRDCERIGDIVREGIRLQENGQDSDGTGT